MSYSEIKVDDFLSFTFYKNLLIRVKILKKKSQKKQNNRVLFF